MVRQPVLVVDPLFGIEFDLNDAVVASPHRTGVTQGDSGAKKDGDAILLDRRGS
jgi:hypothetical protein